MPGIDEQEVLGNSGNDSYHIPVLLSESVDALNINPSGIYVDCTFGGGGHSVAVLSKLNKDGRLYAFDQDEDARANVPADDRLIFIPHNFRHLSRFLRLHKITQVDGILADLGVSSHQFNEPSRGFSIRFDAPLDMRMDKNGEKTAADLLRHTSAEALQLILQEFGEVTNAKTVSLLLTDFTKHGPINTINELKAVLSPVVKGNPNKYFAQVFQALRMAVNEETESLSDLLNQATSLVKPGGRIVVITFHSIEDRIVKNYLRHGNQLLLEKDPIYGTLSPSPFELVNKKPIEPSVEEVKRNPRSRSARLRVAVKK
ncbi:MAG: 16S rRNA (cytosine(1402)-N(4))-methyltransferase [Chitinophagaceae bacterium]|nr:MAG: 16S rRNA (cytosine(1402)-N(4))-methyltransferase [Chitinophagaceae bacterium]